MVFPYEKDAANGEQMPDGLSLVDQLAFRFLRSMYRDIRTGVQTRDQAIEEKGRMSYQYDKEKRSMEQWSKMGTYWAEKYKDIEEYAIKYAKTRTLENADMLYRAICGVPVSLER